MKLELRDKQKLGSKLLYFVFLRHVLSGLHYPSCTSRPPECAVTSVTIGNGPRLVSVCRHAIGPLEEWAGPGSDGGLGEGDSEVLVLLESSVVQRDQSRDGLVHRRQLHQSHLPVLLEKLEGVDGEAAGGEDVLQVILADCGGDVGEV